LVYFLSNCFNFNFVIIENARLQDDLLRGNLKFDFPNMFGNLFWCMQTALLFYRIKRTSKFYFIVYQNRDFQVCESKKSLNFYY
jgi:hypothetical protein